MSKHRKHARDSKSERAHLQRKTLQVSRPQTSDANLKIDQSDLCAEAREAGAETRARGGSLEQ